MRFGSALLIALQALAQSGETPPERLHVVATLPVLADLARQVGGDLVEVRSLGRGSEDPHHVLPTPSLMSAVNRADLFVELGLSLELWAENVLDGARNPRIRRGARGHVFASEGIPRKGVPATVSRAGGDLHPEGNPHLWMDPVLARAMVRNIAVGLKRIAPEDRERIDKRLASVERRIDESLFGKELVELLGGDVLSRLALNGRLRRFLAEKSFRGRKLADRLGGWLGKAEPLRGKRIVFYHESWVYFADRFGLEVVDHVERKPGIAPSAAHKEKLIAEIREKRVPVIGVLTYYDDSVPRALARETGASVVVLPGTVGAVAEARDYFALVDTVLDRLLEVFQNR
ncbi:MAG: metal ABC transporter substrate-binding protein [Planctomycetota bacterium]